MKTICEYLGGSHSYGLSTPLSDRDVRGIFIHEHPSLIIGLDKFEHHTIESEEDSKYREFRSAMSLLRRGNTEIVEALYNENWIVNSPSWKLVQSFKKELVSSETMYGVLRGYAQGELKLANGERTGKLGSKRKSQIDKFGFSPKNFVQLLRLSWAGRKFFMDGFFPVCLSIDPKFQAEMLRIKTQPELYTKEELNDKAAVADVELREAFANRRYDYKFNESLANELICYVYGPIITKETLALENKFRQ